MRPARAPLIGMIVWLLSIGRTVDGQVCNDTCQALQGAAIAELRLALSGYPLENLTITQTYPAGAGTPGVDISALPAHCQYTGVSCCAEIPRLSPPYYISAVSTGVFCTQLHAIMQIVWPLEQLSGSLSDVNDSVWQALAPSLQLIDLHGNSIRGTIPAALGNFSQLADVELSVNSLTGTIPSSLFTLSALERLILDHNLLRGQLPSMSGMTTLAYFSASYNSFAGSIPSDWLSAAGLEQWACVSCNLSGPIPPPNIVTAREWNASTLELRLGKNSLTGALDPSFIFLPIRTIDVRGNMMTGRPFDVLQFYPLLQRVQVSYNQFEGTLPEEWYSNLIEVIQAGGNQLTGTLPASLGNQTGLQYLDLGNNNLTGPLPDSMGTLANLINLNIGNTSISGNISRPNSRGEYLPSWLTYGNTMTSLPSIAHLLCSDLDTLPPLTTSMQMVFDPKLFDYQRCACEAGTTLQFSTTNNTLPTCVPMKPHNMVTLLLAIILPTVLGALVLLGLPWAAFRFFRLGAVLQEQATLRRKRAGPPELGNDVTLVSTDIEGSTELWEFDKETMDDAISLHDKLLRSYLREYSGYEVATEGDAFLIAFHEATDAIKWCIAVQKALLAAPWPMAMQHHPHSCIRTVETVSGGPLIPAGKAHPLRSESMASNRNAQPSDTTLNMPNTTNGPKSEQEIGIVDEEAPPEPVKAVILFHGLCVRMGLATGKVETTQVNPTSGCKEYNGEVLTRCRAIADVARGGQILISHKAFLALGNLTQLLEDIQGSGRSGGSSRTPQRRSFEAISRAMSQVPGRVQSGAPLLRGSPGGSPGPSQDEVTAGQKKSWLRNLLHLPSRAQRSSEQAWQNLRGQKQSFADMAQSQQSVSAGQTMRNSLLMIDMGVHVLKGWTGVMQVHQAAIPGLEERARMLAPLVSLEQMEPSYFDAPGAKLAPLTSLSARLLKTVLPAVTIVFVNIPSWPKMQAADPTVANAALVLYLDCCRRLLAWHNGYECQHSEGDLMLAFASANDAVLWCLLTQEALVQVPWGVDVLALPGCGAMVNKSAHLIFSGPRVRMGLYEGVPTRVCPHTTSGRADYFGPLVNRAARICHGAAQEGQVLAPLDVVQNLLHELAGLQDFEVMERSEPMQLAALPKGSSMATACSIPEGQPTKGAHLYRKSSGAIVLHSTLNHLQSASFSPNHKMWAGMLPSPAVHQMLGRPDGSATIDSWELMQQVTVSHQGSYRFKGIPGVHTVLSLSHGHLTSRVFPPPQASNKKAELAASALGLQAVIMFRAFSSQMSGNNSFSREHSDRESLRGSFTLSHQISSPALQPGVQTASA